MATGRRERPYLQDRPGFLRVDSVHQGDRDGVKDLCHINLVDEVAQSQQVGTAEAAELGVGLGAGHDERGHRVDGAQPREVQSDSPNLNRTQ